MPYMPLPVDLDESAIWRNFPLGLPGHQISKADKTRDDEKGADQQRRFSSA
ncbi:hypothetical protein [Rhodoblastus sp.]|uniref:hypothetical protein n=1 Tax=Rhodoblastus sp. TaxID=1962975 RepID=UPI003F96E144